MLARYERQKLWDCMTDAFHEKLKTDSLLCEFLKDIQTSLNDKF